MSDFAVKCNLKSKYSQRRQFLGAYTTLATTGCWRDLTIKARQRLDTFITAKHLPWTTDNMQLTFILHCSKEIHHWSFLQQEAIRYTKGIHKKWYPLQFPESFYINKKHLNIWKKLLSSTWRWLLLLSGLHLCVSHTLSVQQFMLILSRKQYQLVIFSFKLYNSFQIDKH